MYVDPLQFKSLLVAMCAALSLCIALMAGFLARLAGAHPATAVLRGGAAFAGALGLTILILTALGAL